MALVNHLLQYAGLYGFTIGDGLFSLGVFVIIIVLVKLYNRKRA